MTSHFRGPAVAALSLLLLAACGGDSAPADGGSGGDARPAAPAAAPSGDAEADLLELSDYTLTMEELRRWGTAAAALGQVGRQRPELQDSVIIDAGDPSIDTFADRLDRIPAARKAVEDAGFSPREYAVVTYVVVQSITSVDAVRQGASVEKLAQEAGLNPANLRFAQQHEAEIHAMIARAGG